MKLKHNAVDKHVFYYHLRCHLGSGIPNEVWEVYQLHNKKR